ncbi:MAG: AraC family transcriptional regulator ligand-binding domain-containing protein [Hyphomicrobium sp.]|nr:AraC family transcriptional regulator ligand-binding domain-containing protein [Hyphomicrobium sp.]
MIPARTIAVVTDYLQTRGIRAEVVLRSFDIEVSSILCDNAKIPLRTFADILELSAALLKDDAFGLHLAEATGREPLPLLHYITSNAPTLRASLHAKSRYIGLMTRRYAVSYVEHRNGARLTWRLSDDLCSQRQFIEYLVGMLVVRVRRQTLRSWHPPRIGVCYADPAHTDELIRILGSKLNFGGEDVSIDFDPDILDAPLQNADPELYRELEAYARSLLGLPVELNDFRSIVMDQIARRIATDDTTETRIAAELGTTPRTLQRKLMEAGTNFRTLLDETRMEMARHFLTNTDLPLTEIAFMLGFSELSSFSRAAHKWFGMTPGKLRRTVHGRPKPEQGAKLIQSGTGAGRTST